MGYTPQTASIYVIGEHVREQAEDALAEAALRVAEATAQAAVATTQAEQAAAQAEQAAAEVALAEAQTALATTQATAAAGSVTAASAQAGASAASAGAAQTARTAAETAAATALAAGKIYTSTTLGMAANPTSGAFFYVSHAAPDEKILDLYQNVSGTATFINTYPSKEAIDNMRLTLPALTPVGFAGGFADPYGRMVAGVTEDGVWRATVGLYDELDATLLGPIVKLTASEFPLSWVDSRGVAAGGVDPNGVLTSSEARIETLNSLPVFALTAETASRQPAFQADITLLASYGQSLSRGGITASGQPISTFSRFNNLKFNNELRYSWSSTPTSLVPLTEFELETPISGATECIMERVEIENGYRYTDYSYQLLGTAPGINGVEIAQLTKAGTNPANYARMLFEMGIAKNLANAAGKTMQVGSVFFTHGSGDYGLHTPKATYKSSNSQLVTDIGTDIALLTGQPTDVRVLCAQSADHIYSGGAGTEPYIALAQLELSEEIDNFDIVGPIYLFPKVSSDNVHLTNIGSKWMGAYYGLAYKRLVLDGEPWAPLTCIEAYVQGNIIFARFHVPVGRLVFDTTQVPAQTNMGFSVLNSALAALTVSSVTITGPDTVRIMTTATPAGGRLRYGFGADGGNLRDTQGDRIRFNPSGFNWRMDNWACIQERAL